MYSHISVRSCQILEAQTSNAVWLHSPGLFFCSAGCALLCARPHVQNSGNPYVPWCFSTLIFYHFLTLQSCVCTVHKAQLSLVKHYSSYDSDKMPQQILHLQHLSIWAKWTNLEKCHRDDWCCKIQQRKGSLLMDTHWLVKCVIFVQNKPHTLSKLYSGCTVALKIHLYNDSYWS